MWSQYSNSHTGFLIVFDRKLLINHFNSIFIESSNSKIEALITYDVIDYQEEMPVFTLESLEGNDLKNFVKLFLTKSIDWEYESEFRFFCYRTNSKTFKIPKESIVQVIAGIEIDPQNFKILERICRETCIELVKAKRESHSFKPIY